MIVDYMYVVFSHLTMQRMIVGDSWMMIVRGEIEFVNYHRLSWAVCPGRYGFEKIINMQKGPWC